MLGNYCLSLNNDFISRVLAKPRFWFCSILLLKFSIEVTNFRNLFVLSRDNADNWLLNCCQENNDSLSRQNQNHLIFYYGEPISFKIISLIYKQILSIEDVLSTNYSQLQPGCSWRPGKNSGGSGWNELM